MSKTRCRTPFPESSIRNCFSSRSTTIAHSVPTTVHWCTIRLALAPFRVVYPTCILYTSKLNQTGRVLTMIERTIFREEHEIFRQTVRRFVEREIVPFHAKWEEDGIVPRELWLKAGTAGLLCCTVPEEYGGMGLDYLFD